MTIACCCVSTAQVRRTPVVKDNAKDRPSLEAQDRFGDRGRRSDPFDRPPRRPGGDPGRHHGGYGHDDYYYRPMSIIDIGHSFGRVAFRGPTSFLFDFSKVTTTNYRGNWSEPRSVIGDFMDVIPSSSFSFGWNLLSISAAADYSGFVRFDTGLRLTFNNYVFSHGICMENIGGGPMPVVPTANVRKSKIRADYLAIPLGLSLNFFSFKVYGDITAEFLTNAKSKWNLAGSGTEKIDLVGMREFRSCIEAGLKFDHIGVNIRYSLTPMFKGLSDSRTLTYGFTLDL